MNAYGDNLHGIFVTQSAYLDERRGGGVQMCTREYVEVLEAAGIDLRFCTFQGDRRLSTRVLRRVSSSPYLRPAEPALLRSIGAAAGERAPDFVLLNQVALAALATDVRRLVPQSCHIVLLSHGLESTDTLHTARLRDLLPLSGRLRPRPEWMLGELLLEESRLRQDIDVVCALSPSDVVLEEWVGAKRVDWLPRLVRPSPVDWRPSGDRVGFLGTLDHAPNLEGLVQVLDALGARKGPRVRVIGGPERTGRWLTQRYARVDYLGALDDDTVRREAATWNAFLHPIFCWPRGCSTKLATALGWEIPVISTPAGHRGYEWSRGALVIGETPRQFAEACVLLCDGARASAAQREVVELIRSTPSLADNAARLRKLLGIA